MCDDTKWATKDSKTKSPGSGEPAKGGKPSGITGLKICPQLDRTRWCEKLPRGHDENVCHLVSQKRRDILKMMKSLVDAHVDNPVCPEWDTSGTCENTPGPYRFGVVKRSANNDNYKIIASQLTASGCECIKRNGLQDDCRLPRCRGSPACKITPFPKCEPFLGIPASPSKGHPAIATVYGDNCRCPTQ
ncbi:hypothetical protein J6590_076441 [Homalodisca vitripennis]|nr:hypothetical protein J6590_076441 [Homalodisca vitripennis]